MTKRQILLMQKYWIDKPLLDLTRIEALNNCMIVFYKELTDNPLRFTKKDIVDTLADIIGLND